MSSVLCMVTTPDTKDFYGEDGTLSSDNAGFDLFVPRDVVFAPCERKFVSMEVKAMVMRDGEPQHFWMVPRSSISKTGLMMMNSVGVIDKTYRGDLIAALWNTTDAEVTVKKGQRLVQIVSRDMGTIGFFQQVAELPSTARGAGGFGSSGA